MTVHSKLSADVKAWRAEKALPLGPVNADNFVIQKEATGWTLHVRPKVGMHKTLTGLTPGEANRARMMLCSEGYVGKVVGGAL